MKNYYSLDRNDVVVTFSAFLICLFVALTFMHALIWSIEKEIELGIINKSSEALIGGRDSRK